MQLTISVSFFFLLGPLFMRPPHSCYSIESEGSRQTSLFSLDSILLFSLSLFFSFFLFSRLGGGWKTLVGIVVDVINQRELTTG